MTVTRIAIAGDWHGATKFASKALHYAHKHGAQRLLHVGDFGFWGTADPYLSAVSETAVALDLPVLFIDGNHEHHDELDRLPIQDDGLREVAPHVFHVPRGHRWEWGGVSFLGLGGAPSIDRASRTEGFDWFPQEVISTGQAYRAAAGGHADVMVTHDCPSGVTIPDLVLYEDDTPLSRYLSSHRALLQGVAEQVTPRYLFHGHYHHAYSKDVEFNGSPARVVGLEMNGTPYHPVQMPWNTQVIDVAELNGSWDPSWAE